MEADAPSGNPEPTTRGEQDTAQASQAAVDDFLGASRPGGRRSGWAFLANAVTLLRVALVPVIAVLLLVGGTTARWWAFGIFAFAALTDSIDGEVARRLVGVTRWGQLADPAADKALIVGSLGVLAYLGELPWWAVAVIVLREVAVTVQRGMLVRRGVVMAASRFGKLKTVSQIAAVLAYLVPAVPLHAAEAVLLLAVVMTVASGLEYAVRGQRLQRQQAGARPSPQGGPPDAR